MLPYKSHVNVLEIQQVIFSMARADRFLFRVRRCQPYLIVSHHFQATVCEISLDISTEPEKKAGESVALAADFIPMTLPVRLWCHYRFSQLDRLTCLKPKR